MISSLATIKPNLKPFAAFLTRNFPIGNASLKQVKSIHLYNSTFVYFSVYSDKNNVGGCKNQKKSINVLLRKNQVQW